MLKPIIIVFSAVLASSPAQAQPGAGQTVSERVVYSDLDLASPQGVAALDRRIDAAVERMCGQSTLSLREYQERRICRLSAWESVAQQRRRAIAAHRIRERAVLVAETGR